MAESNIKSLVEFKVTLELTETEARALEAIIGYGIKPFLPMFYKHLGEYYLKKYEKGAVSLFDQRQQLNYQLYNIDQVRKAITGINKNPGLEYELDMREPKLCV
jgi:hypothetical protein